MQTIIFLEPQVNCHFDAFLNAARIEPKQLFGFKLNTTNKNWQLLAGTYLVWALFLLDRRFKAMSCRSLFPSIFFLPLDSQGCVAQTFTPTIWHWASSPCAAPGRERLQREMVESPSFEVLKSHLDMTSGKKGGLGGLHSFLLTWTGLWFCPKGLNAPGNLLKCLLVHKCWLA